MKIRLTALLVYGLTVSMVMAGTPPTLKMTTDIPAGIASPDKVETRLGTMNFFDGFPDKVTVEKVHLFFGSSDNVQYSFISAPSQRIP